MKNRQPGYTLLELMVVVILIGIVSALAAPQLSAGMANNTVSRATNEVTVAFRYARAQAAQYGRAMGVLVNADRSNSIVRVDRSTDNTCNLLPNACNNDDIPTYGGDECGRHVVRFDRGGYPRYRVQLLGIRVNTTVVNNMQFCVTPIGRLMQTDGTTWSRINEPIEIGVSRSDPGWTPVGVVRAVAVGQLGLPRVSLSQASLFGTEG